MTVKHAGMRSAEVAASAYLSWLTIRGAALVRRCDLLVLVS
jgi:hypothetical protein